MNEFCLTPFCQPKVSENISKTSVRDEKILVSLKAILDYLGL